MSDTKKPRSWHLEINKKTGDLIGFARADLGLSLKLLFSDKPLPGIDREITTVVEVSALKERDDLIKDLMDDLEILKVAVNDKQEDKGATNFIERALTKAQINVLKMSPNTMSQRDQS